MPANTVFSLNDLPGKIVACQFGTTGYTYAGNIEVITVEGYDKGADAIKALKKGWADAVIIDSEPAAVFVAHRRKQGTLSAHANYHYIFYHYNAPNLHI